ncbi:uncharacterized protein N7511_008836 [Penicillium nucicola]|uniref:uncharacterized protein n=1 Tax=Penicillium nucicola TaxID=1850975 RepID=UPI00254530B8|nr:uncharacterized protein N7511_008836 [Penicillium nucicola]KAJ5747140.1 hypothetical protein N7511_008836 [Penicillium nucicola]
MYGLKHLSLLSLMLLSASAAQSDPQKTLVGIETAEKSHGVHVLLNECEDLDEEDVLTISLKKPCRLFTGPLCTGHNSFLAAGTHTSKEPIPVINSIFCQNSFSF